MADIAITDPRPALNQSGMFRANGAGRIALLGVLPRWAVPLAGRFYLTSRLERRLGRRQTGDWHPEG